jgi:spermidine/putrescine transport system ATP-binding protein
VVAVNDISLSIRDGEFFSLLGPSGCGKTTTLRIIAGFEMPSRGELLIGGESQGDKPPYRRPVNTVFQSYALFPHMTIFQNVAFGLEMRRVPKAEVYKRVTEALEMVRLPGMEKRKPDQLSGGQQQRIALARALVNRPKVLLLDEPLGALDLKLRKAMQLELKELQQQVGITFVYVTHDQEEALTMSDRIAVMNKGRVLQVGTPEEIYERPGDRFVADFIGETNLIDGTVKTVSGDKAAIEIAPGLVITAATGEQTRAGDSVTVALRPEKITIATTPGDDRAVPGIVHEVIYTGVDTRYLVRLGKAIVTVRRQNSTAGTLTFAEGTQVYLHWPAQAARLLKE